MARVVNKSRESTLVRGPQDSTTSSLRRKPDGSVAVQIGPITARPFLRTLTIALAPNGAITELTDHRTRTTYTPKSVDTTRDPRSTLLADLEYSSSGLETNRHVVKKMLPRSR
jgi:hypothetical protein